MADSILKEWKRFEKEEVGISGPDTFMAFCTGAGCILGILARARIDGQQLTSDEYTSILDDICTELEGAVEVIRNA